MEPTHDARLGHSDHSMDDLIILSKSEVWSPEQEQQEALVRLDAMAHGDIFSAYRNSDIVGVLARIKPATVVSSGAEFEEVTRAMGLFLYPVGHKQVAISRYDELAGYLASIIDDKWGLRCNPDEADIKIGQLLGYPETATDYFVRRSRTVGIHVDSQLPMVIPEKLQNTIHGHFHQFILSPDHWREELSRYVYPLEDAVRSLTPNTYNEIERKTQQERAANYLRTLLGKEQITTASRLGGDVAVKLVR